MKVTLYRHIMALLLLVAHIGLAKAQNKKVEALLESARTAFYNRSYDDVLHYADKALRIDPNSAEAWLIKGETWMVKDNAALAAEGFEKCLDIDSSFYPSAAVSLSRLYNGMMRYDDALQLAVWYKNTQSKKISDLDMLIAQYTFRSEAVKNPVGFDPQSLGDAVNSNADEYVNMLQFEGKNLIFTRREAASQNGQRQKEGLWMAQKEGDGWTKAKPFRLDWEYNDNMGAAFISADGKSLYFTLCGVNPKTGCDICKTVSKGGGWEYPQLLDGKINSSAWDSQPCLSADGGELYFVSRKSGNADIYVSHRSADGSWLPAQALDSTINTKGNEMVPLLHPDGQTLYFSSDGHVGMGGYDIFMSRKGEDGQWQKPVNLGYPINTRGDEINFFVAADGRTAFISSQREGGMGGYDIYTFELPEEIRSDSANYLSTIDVTELAPGDAVILQNIQFEFDKSNLTKDSQKGIEILTKFLQRNPNLKVELAGHTDNIGSDSHNQKLSCERAEVVRKALIANGVEAFRLSAKGYGATKPLAPNDSDEHRTMNRRTEMIINY